MRPIDGFMSFDPCGSKLRRRLRAGVRIGQSPLGRDIIVTGEDETDGVEDDADCGDSEGEERDDVEIVAGKARDLSGEPAERGQRCSDSGGSGLP